MASQHDIELIWGPVTTSGNFTLSLQVTDDKGATDIIFRRITLIQPGDIVVVDYPVGCYLSANIIAVFEAFDPDEDRTFEHAGIVVTGGLIGQATVVEASYDEGVREVSLESFIDERVTACPGTTVELLTVNQAYSVRTLAAYIATLAKGAGYSTDYLQKGTPDGDFYCSELVWFAYQMALDILNGFDYINEWKAGRCFLFLDADDEGQSYLGPHCGLDEPVTPADLYYSKYTTSVATF